MQTQTLISLTPDELREMISEILKNNTPQQVVEENKDLLTRKQVADIFQISLPTLRSWGIRGIIKSIKVGGRRYYRKHEVERLTHEKFKR